MTATWPSEILSFAVVVFEETGRERAVVRDCLICRNHAEVYGMGVLSPSGIAHIAEFEDTLCGKDATGDGWWWPSWCGINHSFENPTERVEATTTPEGAKGWESVQSRHTDTARGHGVDVAPDAQPEGVRAEARRQDDGDRGEPSNAPTTAPMQMPDLLPFPRNVVGSSNLTIAIEARFLSIQPPIPLHIRGARSP